MEKETFLVLLCLIFDFLVWELTFLATPRKIVIQYQVYWQANSSHSGIFQIISQTPSFLTHIPMSEVFSFKHLDCFTQKAAVDLLNSSIV